MMEDTMAKDEGAPTGSDGSDGGSTNIFEGVDAFETNNQEENMDTADQTKSDGTYIYASYADTLVVWNATEGKILSKIQMPKIDYTQSTTTGGGTATNGGMASDYIYRYYDPKPYIEAILLEGDKLALIVSGYGAEYDSERTEAPVICNYMGTRIMIYDTNDGYPELLSQTDVHGSFRQAYSTKKNGHVVTQASIDTWTHLREPIQRWKFPELTDEEYREEAFKIAQELVPKFVATLTEILDPIDITRLSLFVDSITSQETLDGIMSQLKVADTISMVASFVIDDDDSTTSSNVLDVSVGGTLQPGYWGYVYANDQMIILADKGWQWVEDMQEYAEMTFLVGFRLDGASSKHEIIGSVFGSPLNPYSIDLIEKDKMVYLRIATTINFWSGLVFTDGDEVMVDSWGPSDSSVSVSNPGDEESTTWNEIVVLGTESGSGTELKKLSSVRLGKPDEVRLIIGWLSTGYWLRISLTDIYVPLFSNQQRFTAVRFLDDIAYAVTFLRRDPFYSVDLSDPENIAILGELDITGFSEYLHPIEDNKILAVGQETDDEGQPIGLQISLFGASDPTNLTLINRLVLTNEENQWTSSGASWEPKAFRFFTVGEMGILIIPLNVYSWGWIEDEAAGMSGKRDNFEGFVVFTVENDTITRRFDIDHEDIVDDSSNPCDAWCGSLPERSFVIDGNLLTLKSQSVVSTDLDTEKADWFIDMRKEVCCAV
jgi:hypothetical protein